MNILPISNTPRSLRYSIEMLRDEARHLVQIRVVSRHQPIYRLCEYVPAREWLYLAAELEAWNFLLRDRISDLLGVEQWGDD